MSQLAQSAASSIIIIDYGSGNLRSAEKAFARQAKSRPVHVSGRPEDVLAGDHIVLPGVGAFGDCIDGLRAIDGMVEALEIRVLKQARPLLGICVGMQIMCRHGLERAPDTPHQGLGWFDAEVRPLAAHNGLKVPHMGWNEIAVRDTQKVVAPLDGEDVYFVHGFAATPLSDKGRSEIAATTDYGGDVTAILARDNLIGVQFHPEKSQQAGLGFIERFLEWQP